MRLLVIFVSVKICGFDAWGLKTCPSHAPAAPHSAQGSAAGPPHPGPGLRSLKLLGLPDPSSTDPRPHLRILKLLGRPEPFLT